MQLEARRAPDRRKRSVCAVLAAGALLSASLAAQGQIGKESGARLLERCKPALRSIESGARSGQDAAELALAQSCIGFVEGFIWGHGWAAWREKRDMYYCPPEQFSAREAVPVVVSYLEAHPERLDAAAHVLVFAAFSDAFPCVERPATK
jgi:hypothetical protein